MDRRGRRLVNIIRRNVQRTSERRMEVLPGHRVRVADEERLAVHVGGVEGKCDRVDDVFHGHRVAHAASAICQVRHAVP